MALSVISGESGHVAAKGQSRPTLADQANIGAGAAHVQGDHIGPLAELSQMNRPHCAGGGSGQGGADRQFAGAFDRHQPAAGLVDTEMGAWRAVFERLIQMGQVTRIREHPGTIPPKVLSCPDCTKDLDRPGHVCECSPRP